MLRQLAQAVAHQIAALERAYTDEADFTVREFQHLQCAGIADEALDILGDELFGTDEDVHRQSFVAEELRPAGVLGRADASDFCRRAEQRERHLARHHVDLVAVGQRNDDVGFGRSGSFQHRGV